MFRVNQARITDRRRRFRPRLERLERRLPLSLDGWYCVSAEIDGDEPPLSNLDSLDVDQASAGGAMHGAIPDRCGAKSGQASVTTGTSDDDIIQAIDAVHRIDGGAGNDTVVVTGQRHEFSFSAGAVDSLFSMVHRASGDRWCLQQIEHVAFSDQTVPSRQLLVKASREGQSPLLNQRQLADHAIQPGAISAFESRRSFTQIQDAGAGRFRRPTHLLSSSTGARDDRPPTQPSVTNFSAPKVVAPHQSSFAEIPEPKSVAPRPPARRALPITLEHDRVPLVPHAANPEAIDPIRSVNTTQPQRRLPVIGDSPREIRPEQLTAKQGWHETLLRKPYTTLRSQLRQSEPAFNAISLFQQLDAAPRDAPAESQAARYLSGTAVVVAAGLSAVQIGWLIHSSRMRTKLMTAAAPWDRFDPRAMVLASANTVPAAECGKSPPELASLIA